MAVITKHGETRKGVRRDGTLDCRCWCDAQTLTVSAEDVRAGRTGSCGSGCFPGAEPRRAKPGPKGPWKHKTGGA